MIVQTSLSALLAKVSEQRSPTPAEGTTGNPRAPAPQAEAAGLAETPSANELAAAVEHVSRSLQADNRALQFSIDDSTDRVIVRVVDKESGETIREIPPKEVLAIAEAIDRFQKGLLLSQKA